MINLLVVGAGRGGLALLRVLKELSGVRLVGVVDKNQAAPGMAWAVEQGVPSATDYGAFLDSGADLVVEATGDASVHRALIEAFGPRGLVVDALVMKLVMSIVEEEDRLHREMVRQYRERDVIINSTHDAMLAVNAKGSVTLVNAAAERLTNLRAEDILGKPAEQVIPNTRLHVVLRTGVGELNQKQAMGDITVVTNRVPVHDDQGNLLGAVAVFRDITELTSLAEELTNLKEMRTLLSAIIHCTQDAISVADLNGHGILINPAYTRLTGLTEADVIGKPVTVDIAEGESMHLQVLSTGEPVSGVHLKVGPNRRDVLVDVAPIVVDGELKGSVGVIHDVSEIARLTDELDRAKRLLRRLEAKYTFDDIVSSSPLLDAAIEQARRAADTRATVLLRGESGTGKELFAHAIHNASRRRSGRFLRVNCAALAETLLESELFGYVEGAFTGARKGGRPGLFEEANGGTLFLDEIGSVSPGLQAKLLRVLQEKEVVRVGDTKPLVVDVRIIAATHVNLEQAVERDSFREDLYYRLNVVPVFIPPLRQRKEDLPALVRNILRRFNQEYGRAVADVSPEVLAALQLHDWPGNIRELENTLGRAMINMRIGDSVMELQHLPPLGRRQQPAAQQAVVAVTGPLKEITARVERQAIQEALAQAGGNKAEAARRLGIAARSLYYKLQRYGLGGTCKPLQ
ncbi:MAG: sigma 54-interacting transcriptional regulator [Bacillota bacterium]